MMANPANVYLIAGEVYRNRNAAGVPAKYRAAARNAVRGDRPIRGRRGPLRMALVHARNARDCFRGGKPELGNTQLLIAWRYIDAAKLLLIQAIAESKSRVLAKLASERGKASDRQKREVCKAAKAGTAQKVLAAKYGVDIRTIRRWIREVGE